MVFLSKAQQKNKNIETLIDNLWDLNKQGIEFKLEMKLEYGTLVLDNAKMNCMREKMGLAAAVFGKYIEIEKLPNPLSKLTQIQAYNWLQTQVRLDQKVAMGSILKDRVAFGEEESRPSFWNDEVLPWTSVKKTFKNLHVEHPGLINKVKAMIEIRLNGLGKNPESYVARRGEEQIVKMSECQLVEIVAIGTEGNDAESIEVEETNEVSSGATRATTNSPGASPRVPSEVDVDGSISTEEETNEVSSGATRATTNSPGASPRAPSEVDVEGSISTEEDNTLVQEDTASQAGSEDEERDHDETLQLLSKKLQLEQQLKSAMLSWSTSSSELEQQLKTARSSTTIRTRENSPAKEKNTNLNKKCNDCKFKAKTRSLLDQHIRSKHPFNLVDSANEKPTAPRQSKRPRKTTKRDSHIYDTDTDWEEN